MIAYTVEANTKRHEMHDKATKCSDMQKHTAVLSKSL